MPYVSLYRKYRPQRFADVVGQDHVVQTVQNALRAGRIANGYLFCGTRGVAKTTIARIFAKCLSCIGPDGARTAPAVEPCDECIPCRTISAGQCVDVIEMDAASNRSVSDMARVRENVQFGPMENRFKTYIVDEAHQLSSDAKDAFLKTLEEPPANVVFILATTEAHAIPVTIASRCQQFDFKRGSIATITRQIRKVLEAESVSMADDAAALIARVAEGSYRDALSILEQVIAYKREDVTAADVIAVLGAVDDTVTGEVIRLIAEHDAAGAFALAEQVFIGGKDIRQFFKALAAHIRDMLYVSVGARAGSQTEEIGSDMVVKLARQAEKFPASILLRMLEILAEAEKEAKTAGQQRLLLEMTLLRLMELRPAAGGAGSAAAVPTAALQRPAAAAESPSPSIPRSLAPPVHQPQARPEPRDGMRAEPPASHSGNGVARAPEPAPKTPPVAAQAPAEPESTRIAPGGQPMPIARPAPNAHASGPTADPDDRLEYLRSHWHEVIHNFESRSPAGLKWVLDAQPVALTGNQFSISFPVQAAIDSLQNPRRREFLEGVIDRVCRADAGTYRVVPVLARPVAPPPPQQPIPSPEQAREDEGSSQLLEEVIAIFGGRIIEDE